MYIVTTVNTRNQIDPLKSLSKDIYSIPQELHSACSNQIAVSLFTETPSDSS